MLTKQSPYSLLYFVNSFTQRIYRTCLSELAVTIETDFFGALNQLAFIFWAVSTGGLILYILFALWRFCVPRFCCQCWHEGIVLLRSFGSLTRWSVSLFSAVQAASKRLGSSVFVSLLRVFYVMIWFIWLTCLIVNSKLYVSNSYFIIIFKVGKYFKVCYNIVLNGLRRSTNLYICIKNQFHSLTWGGGGCTAKSIIIILCCYQYIACECICR